MLDWLLKENTGNIWDIAYNWVMMIFILFPPKEKGYLLY